MSDNRQKYWMSTPPENCDFCQAKIEDKFYDSATTIGPWGCLCQKCFQHGPGVGRLGIGLAQEYTKQPDGKWLKTGG